MVATRMPHGSSNASYGSLLQALGAKTRPDSSRKRRKLNAPEPGKLIPKSGLHVGRREPAVDNSNIKKASEVDTVDADDDDGNVLDGGRDSDDEDDKLDDPFQAHYVSVNEVELAELVRSPALSSFKPVTSTLDGKIRKTWQSIRSQALPPGPCKRLQELHLKQRLVEPGKVLLKSLDQLSKDFAGAVANYQDVLACVRTPRHAEALREVCMLHSLNHIFKTRDRVLKNNTKIAQADNEGSIEARDQGFTRPKVLIIAPTKQSCVRFVDSIVKLSKPDQQENKSRFVDQYSREDEDEWQEKPEDFRELFGGNHEEDFRIGLKFTRKTIKFFSGFYNSDIIITSPLGLMRTITGSKKDEDEKSENADFLTSIEIAIVDNASALEMQNWQHVEFAFSQLNLMPKEAHGCDYSRVRHWYLDGRARYLRQTIIMSPYLTPAINSLVNAHLQNIAGRAKYLPTYKGAMTEISNLLPTPISQTFLRFDAKNAATEPEARFQLFTSTILSPLLRDGEDLKGVLIFVPTYLDFIRLRNHLTGAMEGSSVSFGEISEYTPVKQVNRNRSYFISGRNGLMLYSERAHHHFRYRLRGVRKILFYGVPENPIFWTEIIALLGMDHETVDSASKGKGLVRALFSKWDAMKLERVVGTERVSRLLSERGGDTFDFV